MDKVAIWARVSSHDQETQNQLDALRDWAKRRNAEVAVEYVLEESAYNGKHRKTLEGALKDARLGRFSVLLVWALDRLSREGPEQTLSIMRRFSECGVRVLSLQESWTDVNSETLPLLVAIMGWLAQQESKRRSERIKAGLARKRKAGLHVGRQFGAKDKKPRKRAGYVERYDRELGRG